jgi:hypothetical protein
VDRRQVADRDGVLAGDRQLVIAVIEEAATQEPCIGAKIGALQGRI